MSDDLPGDPIGMSSEEAEEKRKKLFPDTLTTEATPQLEKAVQKSQTRGEKLKNSGKAMAKYMIISVAAGYAVIFIGYVAAVGAWPDEIETIDKDRKGLTDLWLNYTYFVFGFATMVGFIRGGTKMIDKFRNGKKGLI